MTLWGFADESTLNKQFLTVFAVPLFGGQYHQYLLNHKKKR
jgi:hypothetical protein